LSLLLLSSLAGATAFFYRHPNYRPSKC
jgi:CRISPR/Cas system-associated protein Csm6